VSDVAIRPITPDQHDPVMHYFDMVAYADNPNWSKCYCCERIVEDYESRIVGWCHAAPKSELLTVPGDRAADVGAIVCFVIAPDQRRQGIATQLLNAALDHLRSRGMKSAEAYPWLGEVEPARWIWAQYVGPLSMYMKAGFEVTEKLHDFCIVRRAL
jgi:GNAT superfamily N-acetyltransferase